MYIYISIYMYMCTYIYIDIHTFINPIFGVQYGYDLFGVKDSSIGKTDLRICFNS